MPAASYRAYRRSLKSFCFNRHVYPYMTTYKNRLQSNGRGIYRLTLGKEGTRRSRARERRRWQGAGARPRIEFKTSGLSMMNTVPLRYMGLHPIPQISDITLPPF